MRTGIGIASKRGMTNNKGLQNWACEGEWLEAEETMFTGYDERCNDCINAIEHSWNEHYRSIR